MIGRIKIHDLVLDVHLGCIPAERAARQPVTFNIEYTLNTAAAVRSDDLNDVVNYMDVVSLVKEVAVAGSWALVEKMSAELAQTILQNFSPISWVKLEILKAVIPGARGVSATFEADRRVVL